MADGITIQSGIKHHTNDALTNYALFTSGLNVSHDVLMNYDPLKTGYGRLFMVRKPTFLDYTIPSKLAKFKHILEYGNTAITGINDVTMGFNQLTGGYAGKSFEIPSFATDDTNQFTVNVYEFSGSPIREVIHSWMNGTSDLLTGLAHYNGEPSLARIQANQTAEFIYVATDNTGNAIEYACMFANCFPKTLKNDQFNYQSGEHNLVEYSIDFTCTKYESIQINKVAKELLKRYKILSNSLNFYSGIVPDDERLGSGKGYDVKTGKFTTAAKDSDTASPITTI